MSVVGSPVPNATKTSRGALAPGAQELPEGPKTFNGASRGAPVSLLSSSGSIASDFELANNFEHATTENTALANPSNLVVGQHGSITITQGGTARSMSFGSKWKFAGGTAPSLTATPGAVDVLTYYVVSSTFITAALLKDVK